MRDPYENVVIGNFLYGLGLVFGRRFVDDVPPGVINLLQQTPLDGPLADVHLRYPGIVRLIEFKRASNDSDKETLKRRKLELLLTGRGELQQVSRTIHWYIETAEAAMDWSTRIAPYLDFEIDGAGRSSLIQFIASIADAVARMMTVTPREPECDPEQVSLYLKVLATTVGKAGSSSGLLVMFGKDGVLRYVALNSIFELRHELSVHREHAKELSRQIQRRATEKERSRKGRSYER